MTDRDWDAKMKQIDQQIASLPAHAATPSAGANVPGAAGMPARTSTFGVMARVGLACVLGVAILFWPYGARCGVGLAGYLGAVAMLITAGVWSSIWTWKHRAARAHALSLLLLTWGIVLASADILPRIGYAKPAANHPANWTCP